MAAATAAAATQQQHQPTARRQHRGHLFGILHFTTASEWEASGPLVSQIEMRGAHQQEQQEEQQQQQQQQAIISVVHTAILAL